MTGPVRYRIRHETAYDYSADVVHSHQLLHLVPRPAPYQECLEHSIDIAPAGFRRRDQTDAFGNPVMHIEIEQPHRRLCVSSEIAINIYARPAVSALDTFAWERVVEDLAYQAREPGRDVLEACRFRHESPYVRLKGAFSDYAEDCFAPGRPVLACAQALMTKLHSEMTYAPGETTISTPLLDVLETRRGVCQDYAHLMIACLRSRGLAARYVSGYVRALAPVGTPRNDALQAPDPSVAGLVGGGASHAWVAVYSPPFGWLELDPTNNKHVGTEHVGIAWGRDFGDVSPLRGIILGGGSHQLFVSVTVEPVGA